MVTLDTLWPLAEPSRDPEAECPPQMRHVGPRHGLVSNRPNFRFNSLIAVRVLGILSKMLGVTNLTETSEWCPLGYTVCLFISLSGSSCEQPGARSQRLKYKLLQVISHIGTGRDVFIWSYCGQNLKDRRKKSTAAWWPQTIIRHADVGYRTQAALVRG